MGAKATDRIIEKQADGSYRVLDGDWKVLRETVLTLYEADKIARSDLKGGAIWYRHYSDPEGHLEPD